MITPAPAFPGLLSVGDLTPKRLSVGGIKLESFILLIDIIGHVRLTVLLNATFGTTLIAKGKYNKKIQGNNPFITLEGDSIIFSIIDLNC
jgi:hypothetical protein